MYLKNIKKIMFIILIGIITFGISDIAYASMDSFPEYTKANRDMLTSSGEEYCTYQLKNDFTYSSLGIYQGRNLIIRYNKETDKLQYLIPEKGVWAYSGEAWYDDLTINFDHIYNPNTTVSSLKDYLVNNGTLECKGVYLYANADNNLYLSLDYDKSLLEYSKPYQNSGTKSCGISKKNELESKIKGLTDEFTVYVNNKIKNISRTGNYQFYKNLIEQEKRQFNSQSSDLKNDNTNSDTIPRKKYDLNQKFQSYMNSYIKECDKTYDEDYLKTKTQDFESSLKEISQPYLDELDKVISELESTGAINKSQATNLSKEVSKARVSYESDYQEWISDVNGSIFGHRESNSPYDCDGLLGETLRGHIHTILLWIRIIVPILLIVLGSLDFAKAVLNDDQKALQKATKDFTKRAIAAVAVFFAPLIVMYLIDLIDKVSSVSCDVRGL